MSLLPLQIDTIPAALTARPQWVLWRGVQREGKLTKVPYTCQAAIKASTTDSATWTAFTTCVAVLPQSGCDGLGYVFSPDDDYAGVDLDKCVSAGVVEPWAQTIIDQLDSYTEVSVSGTGIHIILEASLPGGGRKRGAVEMYDQGRYFTMSGQHLPGTPHTIEARQAALDALYAATFPVQERRSQQPAPVLSLADTAILDKASQARNGGKFTQLWAGDTSGYGSQSEADLALCSMLTFYCDGPDQVDRLFRQSGLLRDKWDTRHGQGTYGAQTVSKAWTEQREHFGMDEHHQHRNGHTATMEAPSMPLQPAPAIPDWWEELNLNANEKPKEDVHNLIVILAHHADWQERFWWDTVRIRGMVDAQPVDDDTVTHVACWFGRTLGMSIRSMPTLERAIVAVCKQQKRDLLTAWLDGLPLWDGVERLTAWLHDVAAVPLDAYGMDISRLLPVSMVARALNPGCQYRYVVILEGPEDSGKSKLVEALASPEWYVSYDVNMENKEAHMLLQGVWVAELAELASLSRTEEAKLKAFLTIKEDTYIPKYSNFTRREARRTIFIGTVNPEEPYLKGQTGNTRFLPIRTGHIEVADLVAIREQLFAEAVAYYQDHPTDWWQLSQDGASTARDEREQRRQRSEYEDPLQDWLERRRFVEPIFDGYDHDGKPIPVTFTKGETTFEEIAKYFLKIESPERWKDVSMQKQIGQSLRALKWESKSLWRHGKTIRGWIKREDRSTESLTAT